MKNGLRKVMAFDAALNLRALVVGGIGPLVKGVQWAAGVIRGGQFSKLCPHLASEVFSSTLCTLGCCFHLGW